MGLTREEYIEMGEPYPSPDVIEQTNTHLELAKTDEAGLIRNGWPAQRTEDLKVLLAKLVAANQAYEAKFGHHTAAGGTLRTDTRGAKKWRLRALAIGRNCLAGEALAEMERHAQGTGGRPARLALQIQNLLNVANTNKDLYRANGADDAFFAQAKDLGVAISGAATERTGRRKNLTAEHDTLDDLDGQIIEQLKALNRSGRAFHFGNDDGVRASEYTLDILRRRHGRSVAPPSASPPPGGGGA